MIKIIKVFQIVYILLLTFMFANVLLGFFGYAFLESLAVSWSSDHSESQLVSLLSKTCSKLEESCKCSFESLCYGDSSIFH